MIPPGSDWRGCLYRAVELSLMMAARKLAPALAAGRCVVISLLKLRRWRRLNYRAGEGYLSAGGAQCPVRTRAG